MISSKQIKHELVRLSICFIIVLLTNVIWYYGNLHPAISSTCIIVVYLNLFQHHKRILVTSTFAGMTNFQYYDNNYGFLVLSSFFVYINSMILRKKFKGFGGKPGFNAFCANIIACFFIYLLDYSNILEYYDPFLDEYYYDNYMFNPILCIFGPLITCITSLACYFVDGYIMKKKNKILAVFVTGLIIILSINTLQINVDNSKKYREIFCNYSQMGLFIAVTNTALFDKVSIFRNYKFFHFGIMAYLTGWINVFTMGVITVGGKNGFNAFVITNIYIRFVRKVFQVKERKKSDINLSINKTKANTIEMLEIQNDKMKGSEFTENSNRITLNLEEKRTFNKIDMIDDNSKSIASNQIIRFEKTINE